MVGTNIFTPRCIAQYLQAIELAKEVTEETNNYLECQWANQIIAHAGKMWNETQTANEAIRKAQSLTYSIEGQTQDVAQKLTEAYETMEELEAAKEEHFVAKAMGAGLHEGTAKGLRVDILRLWRGSS